MSQQKIKHFDNPYEDYSPGRAVSVILLGKPHKTSPIVTNLESRWEDTLKRLSQADHGDSSVYTGTAGIALLRLLKSPDDKQNLEEIVDLLRLHKVKGRRHSFLCGSTGPLAIGAVVYHRLGKPEEMKKAIDKLVGLQDEAINSRSDLPNEYLYGRVGYLFALAYANKYIQPPPISLDLIKQVADAVLTSGRDEAKKHKFSCPLMYQWHDSYYLGAAHGLCGILYLLLQIQEALTDEELNEQIKPTIDYLAGLRFPSGNYPSSLGSESDKYIQWCHGAPGFVYLFSMAYKTFNEQRYLKLAQEAGNIVWKRGLIRKGYSLCHGVSGNAYCFLELYQTFHDEKYLYRAIKFAEWCVNYSREHEEHTPDRPLSLYEGIAGPMYLLLDIQNPVEAKFPGFTL